MSKTPGNIGNMGLYLDRETSNQVLVTYLHHLSFQKISSFCKKLDFLKREGRSKSYTNKMRQLLENDLIGSSVLYDHTSETPKIYIHGGTLSVHCSMLLQWNYFHA